MQIKLQEYGKFADEPYFFENDENRFVSEEALEVAMSVLSRDDNWKPQITALLTMERLKLKLAEGKLAVEEYRKQLKTIMQEFFKDNGYPVLDETEAAVEFYKIINNYYAEKGGA
ncbi:MAG: hypothetical protein FWG90_02465 [Oscillospiraceae bacterium]|nr:hypothetical protein [Oscillospiraceae bacterium]